ncbi:MAG TPA: hypothetical protein VLC74_12270 [Rhizomicrobium sp.]|nr:hypothetical protein [Rhizomicrobium sp.]
MPLTPEDTQTAAEESGTGNAEGESASRLGTVWNSKYLKPVAALLVALGAGFVVQMVRDRKRASKK